MEYCPWYLIHILVTKHPQQQMTDPDISQQIINNNEEEMMLLWLCFYIVFKQVYGNCLFGFMILDKRN